MSKLVKGNPISLIFSFTPVPSLRERGGVVSVLLLFCLNTHVIKHINTYASFKNYSKHLVGLGLWVSNRGFHCLSVHCRHKRGQKGNRFLSEFKWRPSITPLWLIQDDFNPVIDGRLKKLLGLEQETDPIARWYAPAMFERSILTNYFSLHHWRRWVWWLVVKRSVFNLTTWFRCSWRFCCFIIWFNFIIKSFEQQKGLPIYRP